MWVGGVMGPRLATIVVESHLLVREALKSLMAKHSYRVVCDVASTAEISGATISEEPKLVVLGAQSADNALTEAVDIRKLWPDSKIILLFEHASLADLQKLLTSQNRWLCSVVRISRHADRHARHDRDQECPRHGHVRRESSDDPTSAAREITSVRDQDGEASVGRRRT